MTVSDDQGRTWRTNNQTFAGMDEAALVEVPDTPGHILLNMRYINSIYHYDIS